MSEEASRSGGAFDRVVGNLVNGVVTAWIAAHGGSPDSAVAMGGIVGPLAEEISFKLRKIVDVEDQRSSSMLEQAADGCGVTYEELIDRALQDSARVELLLRAVEASRRSSGEKKIELLASMLRMGAAAADDAIVDDYIVAIDALRQIESPHIRVLLILLEPSPVWWPNPDLRDRLRYSWPEERIVERDRGLTTTFPALISKLASLGMVQNLGIGELGSKPMWSLTSFGKLCLNALEDKVIGQNSSAQEN